MRASVLTTIAASALAAAAPAAVATGKGHFNISNFLFSCHAGCSYSFKVTVSPEFPNHPEVNTAVDCSGSLAEKSYKQCGNIGNGLSILAYIDKDSKLKLQYVVNNLEAKTVYKYSGETTVYDSTSPNASMQKSDFAVIETLATGIA